MDIQKLLQQITSPQITNVISQGLAQIYQNRPAFPVTFLAQYLQSHSQSQKRKLQLINFKSVKEQKYQQIQSLKKQLLQKQIQQKLKQQKTIQQKQSQYQYHITQTKHLQDLLHSWLPQYVEKQFKMTGVYVGKLDFNKKNIQEGNFQIGAENDTQNPKIISYIGASDSHKQLMLGSFLPNGKGVSYDIFQQKQQEGNQQGTQQANAQPKKRYLYINNVLKQSRLHYFRYPKLGSYACYPIKIKSCLNIPTLDKGIVDYKAYLKTKEQTQKQYNQKVTQARTQAEDTLKKFEDFQLNEQDPASHQQRKNLQNDAKNSQQKLQQLLKNPPIIQQVKFQTVQKNFFIAVDRLGQDKQISQKTLQSINSNIQFFISQWQQKQKKMLLTDILTFLQEQTQLQNIENVLQQHQKSLIANYEAQIKEQFANKQKQAQFQLSLIKCQKTRHLLNQNQFKSSMEVYLNYNVPKFTELIQIWCMLMGLQKNQINMIQSNQLNHRKIINSTSFKNLLQKLQKYQLRRQSSESVAPQYKINKLLQRLQKIDSESLAKYNAFLFVLHYLLKTYCWTRILCRDAKKQLFEAKTKQKEDRDNQIQKWLADIQKNLQTAKAQLDQQGQQNFKQQDWRKNYETQTPKPQPLQSPVLKQFLDIE